MIRYAAQHYFLEELIDYAGTFPPASQDLPQSLANFRQYQKSSAASMLGRFICAGTDLEPLLQLLQPSDRLRLSVILHHPEQVDLIKKFHSRVPKTVRVDTVETGWNNSLSDWVQAWNYSLFFEVTEADAAEAAVQCMVLRERLGLKLRTGSIISEAIPKAEAVVSFLQLVQRQRLAYKFTAGLHHVKSGDYALTYAPDSERGYCFGFVSLFALACLHWYGRLSAQQVLLGLREEVVPLMDASGLHWGGASCSAAEIKEYRCAGGRSFGSCSFEEPWQELQEIGWIC